MTCDEIFISSRDIINRGHALMNQTHHMIWNGGSFHSLNKNKKTIAETTYPYPAIYPSWYNRFRSALIPILPLANGYPYLSYYPLQMGIYTPVTFIDQPYCKPKDKYIGQI